MNNVGCSPEQYMIVKKVDYGDFDRDGTFNMNAKTDKYCSSLTNCQVKSLCGGKKTCELTMNENLLPSEFCSESSKAFYTEYTCVDRKISNIITGKFIRGSFKVNFHLKIQKNISKN